jgi:hypothetical protein
MPFERALMLDVLSAAIVAGGVALVVKAARPARGTKRYEFSR